MALAGHDQRRRTARRRLILTGVAAAAVIAGAVTAMALGLGSGSSTDSGSPSTSATTPNTSPSPPSAAGGGPTGVTLLPKPQRVVKGVPLGYPHTVLGAVSAAAHYTDVVDVFSPTAAQQQAETFAEPNFAHMIGMYALYSAQKARISAGLPQDGESDTGTYSVNQSRAYQTRNATADRVTVWLLVRISTSVHGVSTTTDQVEGTIMVWKGSDWKLSIDSTDSLPKSHPLVATPGSAQAVSRGWKAIGYQK